VLQLLPPVRIHAWGGLGSQLFAIALAEDFKASFPNRSLRIVLHTGGVTRRHPEVTELFQDFEYQYEEDFQPRKENPAEALGVSKFNSREFAKRILVSLGLLAICNDDNSTRRLFPWVLSIRGHYSYRGISEDFLRQLALMSLASSKIDLAEFKEACVLHYRLGDLLTLSEKNPISVSRLASEYSSIKKQMCFRKLIVFSDSPSEVTRSFTPLIQDDVEVLDFPTSQVIASAVSSKYFVGTSSKVSFWIASIRAVVHGNRSALPRENYSQYTGLLGSQSSLVDEY
jgi:hypothetical protein